MRPDVGTNSLFKFKRLPIITPDVVVDNTPYTSFPVNKTMVHKLMSRIKFIDDQFKLVRRGIIFIEMLYHVHEYPPLSVFPYLVHDVIFLITAHPVKLIFIRIIAQSIVCSHPQPVF